MRLLLDTQAWLWMIGPQERLSDAARAMLEDGHNDLYLSTAAVWEIGIKHAAGKLKFTGPLAVHIPMQIRRSGVRPLAPTVEHVLRAAALPMHHRDPFDRLMVAQAQEEELALLTTDDRLSAYEVEVIPAGR